jgi:hypothetical protein
VRVRVRTAVQLTSTQLHQKVRQRSYRSMSLGRILSRFHLPPILRTHIPNINFNAILPSPPSLPKLKLVEGSAEQNFVCISCLHSFAPFVHPNITYFISLLHKYGETLHEAQVGLCKINKKLIPLARNWYNPKEIVQHLLGIFLVRMSKGQMGVGY